MYIIIHHYVLVCGFQCYMTVCIQSKHYRHRNY